jgi:hypothetical protein
MSTATVDLTGLDRVQARLRKIEDPDATPLMATWMRIIDDDNRRGVLAGLDKNGNPMIPVSYRPLKSGAQPLTVEQRLGQKANIARGRYAAFGSVANAPYNNLTSSQYRRLGGPPLAPRGQFSRAITNLLTDFDDSQRSRGIWEAWGYWDEVVSAKGEPFLLFHFEGQGHNPIRDLRGVRPAGRELVAKATREWAYDMIRSSASA